MSSIFNNELVATDEEYIAIRDQPRFENLKGLIEDLWVRFEPFADNEFRIELGSSFHSRFWEMYLVNVLSEYAFELSQAKPTQGPDILISYEKSNIWIEATAPGPGEGVDAVPKFDDREMFSIVPDEKIILRLTSAISEKKRKFDDYLSKGIISKEDYMIIAINGRRIPHVLLEDEIPFVVMAVLPFGDPYVTIDIDKNEIIDHGYHHRGTIKKISGSEVPTYSFLNPEYSNISGILYSFADVWNYPSKPGAEFIILHNPIAKRPLPHGLLKVGREFWVEGNKLERRTL